MSKECIPPVLTGFTRRLSLLALAAVAGAALSLPAALAADSTQAVSGAPVYTVEIVIFRAIAPSATVEDWKAEAAATVRAGNEETSADESDEPAPAIGERISFQQLAAAQFKLAGTDAALRRSPAYEVLAHFAWMQPVTAFGTGAGIPLSELGATQALSGQVGLEQGRYLHLNLDLSWTPADPPAALLGRRMDPGTAGPVTFKLKQKRRVRPFEQHYFDHPAFGVIAMVTPMSVGQSRSGSP